MSNKLDMSTDELRKLPLLRGLEETQLRAVAGLFERAEVQPGDTLFDVGAPAEAIHLLARGRITLYQADGETHVLRGPCVIGELGAITGLRRASRAVIGDDVELWNASRDTLLKYFARHQDAGLRFEHNLLDICADKISRDQTRFQDMRQNLMRTQKAMKQMRDLVLDSVTNSISDSLHRTLTETIERNRRVNYRVIPTAVATATIRLQDGSDAPVVEISRTHVSFEPAIADVPAPGARFTAVLNLGGPEIPVSGDVLRLVDGRVEVRLDLLIDEYAETLESYLTGVQMLDILV